MDNRPDRAAGEQVSSSRCAALLGSFDDQDGGPLLGRGCMIGRAGSGASAVSPAYFAPSNLCSLSRRAIGMRLSQHRITIRTTGIGLVDVTAEVAGWLAAQPIRA